MKTKKEKIKKGKEDYLKNRLATHKRLAQERTVLANERNFLAYIRTGLAFLGLGVAFIKLFEEHIRYVYGGYVSAAVGVSFILVGIISEAIRRKKIMKF